MANPTAHLADLSLHDLATQLLDRASGHVELAEVYAYDTTSTPVDFESNRLKSLETKDTRGIALRVVKDGRVGLATTTRLRAGSDLDQVVADAVALSAFGAEAKFDLPGHIVPTPVTIYDQATSDLTVETMVGLGQEMIDHVRAYDADILCEAGVRRAIESVVLVNSRGGEGAYRKSSYALVIGGQLIRDTDFLSIWEYDTQCGVTINARALAEAAVRKFEMAKPIAQVRTARMPVIFTPRGVIKPGRIGEPGVPQLKGRGLLVHPTDEPRPARGTAPANAVRNRLGSIVSRVQHQAIEQFFKGQLFAGSEAHHGVVGVDPSGFGWHLEDAIHRGMVKRDHRGHDLGGTGNEHLLVRLLRVQDLTLRDVHDDPGLSGDVWHASGRRARDDGRFGLEPGERELDRRLRRRRRNSGRAHRRDRDRRGWRRNRCRRGQPG